MQRLELVTFAKTTEMVTPQAWAEKLIDMLCVCLLLQRQLGFKWYAEHVWLGIDFICYEL